MQLELTGLPYKSTNILSVKPLLISVYLSHCPDRHWYQHASIPNSRQYSSRKAWFAMSKSFISLKIEGAIEERREEKKRGGVFIYCFPFLCYLLCFLLVLFLFSLFSFLCFRLKSPSGTSFLKGGFWKAASRAIWRKQVGPTGGSTR